MIPKLFNGTNCTHILFIGSADDLAAFVKELRSAEWSSSPVGGIASGLRLLSPAEAKNLGCRALALARLVVLAASVPLPDEIALDCVARGAKMLFLRKVQAGPLARFPSPRPLAWGFGKAAWVPALDPAARAAGELLAFSGYPDYSNTAMWWIGSRVPLCRRWRSGRKRPESRFAARARRPMA